MDPKQCTLYTGGYRGAEAEFGKEAEKWGVKEVSFSYEGQTPFRSNGLVLLSPEEMRRGDISMEIVCTHMGRSYSSAETIRKVMQILFHMVNSGYQIFAVGYIQPNETVKGGTGWAVELAKLFNRPLSVFDQDRKAWFSWIDKRWVESTPVIEHNTFVGTGTRRVTKEGLAAINDLFRRSFGSS
ncbi:MAG: hypothetical protein AB2L11_00620 [Syntrophobacteraceae bacterium]